MAARYWRVVGVVARSGGHLALAGAELWLDGVRSTIAVACTLAPVSGSVSNLSVESNTDIVEWSSDTVATPGFALVWDLLSTPTGTVGLKLKAGSSEAGYPRNLVIQSSPDMVVWTTEQSYNEIVFPGALRTNALVSGSVESDASAAYVVLKTNFDGGDGSTIILDSGPMAVPITCVGGAKLSNAIVKFGSAALALPSSAAYLSLGGLSNFTFGSGDFTIEFFVYYTSVATSPRPIFIGSGVAGGSAVGIVQIYITAAGGVGVETGNSAGGVGGSFVTSQWNHIELNRASGVVRLFLNGALVYSYSDARTLGTPGLVYINQYGSGSYGAPGYIDDLRITKGVARHTAAFTPPVLSFYAVAFNDVMETSLLPSKYAPSPVQQGVSVAGYGENDSGITLPESGVLSSTLEYAGPGGITGTVFEKATPANKAVRRRVRLFDERSALCTQEVWSDPTTGAYQFVGVPLDTRYTVIAYDHTGAYRGVIADGQFAERMK